MINVNQITAQLSRMPDQALQQYAAMHKDDPYTVSLALSESNRRKQMRAAAPQGGAQQQQPVVDQEIAQMNPMRMERDMAQYYQATPGADPNRMARVPIRQMAAGHGLEDLPADNLKGMATMAGGGIVAFDGGGGVLGDMPGYVPGQFQPTQAGVQDPNDRTLLQKLFDWNARGVDEQNRLKREGKIAGAPTDSARPMVNPSAYTPSVENLVSTAPGALKSAAPVKTGLGELPVTGSNAAANVAAGAGNTTKTTAGIGGLPTNINDIKKMYEDASPKTDTPEDLAKLDRFALQRKAVTDEEARVAKTGLARLEDEIKNKTPALAETEKRAKGKEERLNQYRDQLFNMSVMEAGMAVMAGKSPYALTNLGEGLQIGTKSYKAGLDKLEDSRDKLDDMFGKIEEVRRNESNMDKKELRTARNDIDKIGVQAKKDALNAYETYFKMGKEDATKAVDKLFAFKTTMYEQQQANARTAMTVNAPGGQERLFTSLGGGDIKKGLGIYADVMGPEAKGEQAILAKYAGPQGAIALQMLEASGPEGKAQAQLIRQKLQNALLRPVAVDNARP